MFDDLVIDKLIKYCIIISMSERENRAFNFTGGEIYETTREMMGPYRVEPLSAFSTEEHLQRTLNALRDNPNKLTVDRSEIIGGNALLKEHQEDLEMWLYAQDVPNKVPRAAALNRFFNIGFGLVERTVVSRQLGRGNEMVSPRAHKEWTEAPQAERVTEMHAYLEAQGADLLARNLLEGDQQQGSMMQFACDLTVSISRVTGEEPYRMNSSQDPDAKEQVTEGVLAALYLLREHQVAQEMYDMDKALAPPEQEKPSDETPPGYYLG